MRDVVLAQGVTFVSLENVKELAGVSFENVKERADGQAVWGDVGADPFDDDTPIVAQCDLSSPEVCESCQ